ncbi:hypothetical protein I541_5649 [Mycobacteroides abscessus]|uniref:hypothetical protein n=1 Tax=Mycobacteroides abscessus TaxID=36809 RepID=UPI0004519D9A|nr:hypothetical protein [Mycobacteroides abscessus]EUA66120.1 hypothetical protein I541_5649 [Mycobacteroides abscessus]
MFAIATVAAVARMTRVIEPQACAKRIRRRLPARNALVVSTHEEHRVVHAGPISTAIINPADTEGHRNQPALGEPGK